MSSRTIQARALPNRESILSQLREMRDSIQKKYKISLLGLFGSVARGEQKPDSDIDILIKLEPGATIMNWSALRLDLIDIFGREVDLADSENLRERYKPLIFKDLIPIA